MMALFDEVRFDANLFSAWRHVKRSALNSKNPKIQGEAAEFEHNHQRHLKRIADQLRNGKFVFDSVEGVLKDKKKRKRAGKEPRPITVAPLKNRIVQRAILQVLQPRVAKNERDIKTKHTPVDDDRLGKLNRVNRSDYGVGGLMSPYGGVQPAINLIMEAMSQGATYYYQSDIKAFFTKIPTKIIVETVEGETNDEALAQLFDRALKVDLSNKEELITYEKLFPSGGIGVAQGSSLSTFAGNVLLYDFDHQLNSMGVRAVRYIDDLLIVSDSKQALDDAIVFSKKELGAFRFLLYETVAGSDKASRGKCSDSFNFLGCTLQPNRCVPSKQSIAKLNSEISDTISKSKSAILEMINKGKHINQEFSRSSVLHTMGRKLYGWQKSFSFCTDAQAFKKLDADVIKKVSDYEQWVQKKTRGLTPDALMQIVGIPSTERLFETDRAKKSP